VVRARCAVSEDVALTGLQEVIEYEAQETQNSPETFMPELLHKVRRARGTD
jgi:hypothetical protein